MTNILFNFLGVCFVVKRINQLFLAQGEYSGGRDTLQSRSMLPMLSFFVCVLGVRVQKQGSVHCLGGSMPGRAVSGEVKILMAGAVKLALDLF